MTKPEKTWIDNKIKRQILFFVLLFFLFVFLTIKHFIHDDIPLKLPVFSFLIGIILGTILSRIQNVTWDNQGKQIIKKFDLFGGLLLFFLILFNIFKNDIVHEFIHIEHISAIVFALNAGIMLGRTYTIRHQIKKILLEKGINR